MDTDIRDELERCFGEGPTPPPTDLILTRGRRALRRRRLTAGAAAVAVVAVLGGGAWAAGGAGDDRASGVDAAGSPNRAAGPEPGPRRTTHPAASEVPARTPPRSEVKHVLVDLDLVSYDDHGKVVIDPRATVLDRVDNPAHVAPPRDSVAVRVRYRGAEYWYALDYAGDGSSGGTTTFAGNSDQSFAAWVRANSREVGDRATVGPDVWPGVADLDLVRFVGQTEELAPVGRARIVEQRAHVSVGGGFAGPGDHTAVADVEAGDGRRYYVLARSFDGKPGQYIAVSRSDGGATLDDFLRLARKRYAEGGGGLL